MKILDKVSKDKVYAAWLKSELFKYKEAGIAPTDEKIIVNPDFANEEENKRREELLLSRRKPIIETLPADITWHEILIQEDDLGKTYIIPVHDWFLDTGKTFQLINVKHNLKHKRGNKLPGRVNEFDHLSSVIEKGQFLDKNSDRIIFVSSNASGPFTIIDGVHRACCLARNDKYADFYGYLGVSPSTANYRWSVEFNQINQILWELGELSQKGVLW